MKSGRNQSFFRFSVLLEKKSFLSLGQVYRARASKLRKESQGGKTKEVVDFNLLYRSQPNFLTPLPLQTPFRGHNYLKIVWEGVWGL